MAEPQTKNDDTRAAELKQKADAEKARAAHAEAVFSAPQTIGKLLSPFTNEEKVRILQSVRLLLGLGANNQATPRATR